MKVSIKELIQSIIDIADEHLDHIVRTEYVVSLEGIDIKKAKDWPAIFIMMESTTQLAEVSNTVSLTFYFMDAQVSQNDSVLKDLEIKSDLLQSASILFDYLQDEDILFQKLDIALTPFDGFNNGLAGWLVTQTFNIAKPCFKVITPNIYITSDSTIYTSDSTLITSDQTIV